MLFYVDGKKERYNPYNMKKDKKIGEGQEVDAYVVGDQVVKFYKPYCKKTRLSLNAIERLKKISTSRILLPTASMLDKKRNLRGYKMDYVENLGEDSFLLLPSEKRKEELKKLKEDVLNLSDNGVILEDLHQLNTVYNNVIYFIDPGSYKFVKDDTLTENDKIQCYGINIDRINEFLISSLSHFSLVKHTNMTNSYLKSEKDNMIDYLFDRKENTLKDYVDNMSKKR